MAATRATNPAARDAFLDAVRAVAVVRVVTWHTYGWAPITWVVAAVPAMFFVSGHLLARSFARRSPRVVVADRLRRLLVPFWCFGLVAWLAMALAHRLERTPETSLPWRSVVWWVLPFNDPHGSVWEGGWLSQPLWYVRCLFWLLLLAPLLHALARRSPRVVLVGLVAITIGLEAAYRNGTWQERWAPDLLWRSGDLALYAVFLVLGFWHAHAEARGRTLAPRTAAALALLAVPAAVVVARVAPPQDHVVNNNHVLHLVVGGGWLALALAGRALLTSFASRGAPAALVGAIGRRSLSIYLWHSAMVITTWHLLVPLAPLPRGVHSVLLGAGTVVGTLAVVSLVGGIEDLAARRRSVRARTAVAPAAPFARRALSVALLLCVGLVLLPPSAGSARPELAAAPGVTGSRGAIVGTAASKSSSAPAAPRIPSRAPTIRLADGASTSASGAASAGATAGGDAAADVRTGDGGDATSAPADGDIARVVSRWQDRYSSSGVVVGVSHGSWEWTGGPYDSSADGSYDVESITKTVTASAVWILAREGALSVDGPLPRLDALPELAARGLTVRNLLEHTSGIPDYHDLTTPEDVGENPAVTVVRGALAADPEFAPGQGHDYSSTNYLVLGLVIEAVTGRPLDDVLWGRVLEPAGVGDLFRRAGADVYLPGGGAGGLVTNPAGLLAWGRAFLRDHRPVGASVWGSMTRFDPTTGLGAGVMGMCPCTGGFLWVGHTGGTTALFYDARDDVMVTVRIANGIWGGFEDAFAELMEDLRTNALVH